ncbi:MAG: hypothetical protein RLZZ117_2437 [Cyanobacteriota bacterium]
MQAQPPAALSALDSLSAASRPPSPPSPQVVVVGAGLATELGQPDSASARASLRLARDLTLQRLVIQRPEAPHDQLQRLQTRPEGWLASLPLDPGHPLEAGGTWAEALGAWRQPTLLVIDWRQLPSGAAAAGVALLRQWRVPLLGLVQWGGLWSPEQRRKDGLPWLGGLVEEGGAAVAALLLRRWQGLDHPWSAPSEA